jgi:hypothetical protein
MKDSTEEQFKNPPAAPSKINRRDMTKLLGLVTALSASLGVTFTASASSPAAGAQLKLKFFQQTPGGDPAKARLLCTIDLSPEDQQKLAASEGPLELRMVALSTFKDRDLAAGRAAATSPEVTISSTTIAKANWSMIKEQINRRD